MNKVAAVVCVALIGAPLLSLSAAEDTESAAQLADAVWKASGGEAWPKVKTIDFTFAVEKGGKELVAAEHHWDVAAQIDHVKWQGKDVKVNLANPATTDEEKAAYARWVNDSYWLLAPLKLKDPGVNLTDEGKKTMDGGERVVLRVSFGKVGLTPNDQYRLYIDPKTKLISSWDYMPEPGKSTNATWSDYQKSGGLTLATDHRTEGGVRIRIVGLKVTTE
ncbi:MAG: DUF6503 family protein [Spartobacteria bacterium]